MNHNHFVIAALVVLTFAIVSCIDTNRFLSSHPEYQKQKAPTAFLIIAAALLIISLFK